MLNIILNKVVKMYFLANIFGCSVNILYFCAELANKRYRKITDNKNNRSETIIHRVEPYCLLGA